jgi:6-pyruvoyltetrahydropterin/6-carboxytetrahydropterin synthase
MKAYLTRRYAVAASHRLHSGALSETENRETYGKCNNPYGHGHNYAVEVTVSGQVNPTTGMICNLVEIDDCFRHEVWERFDHQNLNMLPEFTELVPTTENLAAVIYQILKREFHSAHLEKVRIEETLNNSFEYCGDTPALHGCAPH